MDNERLEHQQRKAREKIVLIYLDAFERDDDERMTWVLREAEHDPELGKLIWEVHATYQAELEEEQREQDVALVRSFLQQHIPSGWEREAEEIPPLTVSDVVAHMQTEVAVKGGARQEVTAVAQKLRQSTMPLPKNMGLQGVRKLFTELGIQASKQVQRLFSEAALILISQRDQNITQLAATRRQRASAYRPKPPQPDEEQV
jgi:hypothetical protein